MMWRMPLLALWVAAASAVAAPQWSFEQRLGAAVPLASAFRDTADLPVTLGSYFGNAPVVMVLGYYHCPRLCSTVMDGILQSLQQVDLDYVMVGIGIDPSETPPAAARKRAAYLTGYGEAALAHTHLLTGGDEAIRAVAGSVGFAYRYDEESGQYAHPAGFIVLTPEGRVSRYFPGVRFAARDVRLALVEASAGRIGTLADQLVLMCSHYDPLEGRYTTSVMRLMRFTALAACLALTAGVFWAARRRRGRP